MFYMRLINVIFLLWKMNVIFENRKYMHVEDYLNFVFLFNYVTAVGVPVSSSPSNEDSVSPSKFSFIFLFIVEIELDTLEFTTMMIVFYHLRCINWEHCHSLNISWNCVIANFKFVSLKNNEGMAPKGSAISPSNAAISPSNAAADVPSPGMSDSNFTNLINMYIINDHWNWSHLTIGVFYILKTKNDAGGSSTATTPSGNENGASGIEASALITLIFGLSTLSVSLFFWFCTTRLWSVQPHYLYVKLHSLKPFF